MDDCPIPVDLNIQRHWRDHSMVTDEMVAWLKKEGAVALMMVLWIWETGNMRPYLVRRDQRGGEHGCLYIRLPAC